MGDYHQKVTILLQRHSVRYLFVGVTVYALELLIIVIAQHLGASSLMAVTLSFWLGFLISFGLQKLVAFEDKRMKHKIVISQFMAVGLLVLFNYGFTLAMTHLLRNVAPIAITRTIALGITTMWNFYLYKTRIFSSGAADEVLLD